MGAVRGSLFYENQSYDEFNSYKKVPTYKFINFIVYYDRGEKNNGKTNEFK